MRNGDALAIAGLAAYGYHQQREMPVNNVRCFECRKWTRTSRHLVIRLVFVSVSSTLVSLRQYQALNEFIYTHKLSYILLAGTTLKNLPPTTDCIDAIRCEIFYYSYTDKYRVCMGNGAKSPVSVSVCLGLSPPSTSHICFAASSVSLRHSYKISGPYFEENVTKNWLQHRSSILSSVSV